MWHADIPFLVRCDSKMCLGIVNRLNVCWWRRPNNSLSFSIESESMIPVLNIFILHRAHLVCYWMEEPSDVMAHSGRVGCLLYIVVLIIRGRRNNNMKLVYLNIGCYARSGHLRARYLFAYHSAENWSFCLKCFVSISQKT